VSSDEIRTTIKRYQSTFSSGDRDGWLELFMDDASLEDPVGTPARQGRDDIGAFWDEIHRRGSVATVRMVQGPAVCGLEALWAFEVRVGDGDAALVLPVIDHGMFSPEGRIRRIRAFWNTPGPP
jgi:steroid delta-isomerase